MDDITIATKTDSQAHIAAVTDVLQVTNKHDLYFKPEKCVFHAPSINYLGVILEEGVTRMDPVKVHGVLQLPQPQSVTEVCSFLGFCNYYRMFIPGFAHKAKPLTMLMKKNAEWEWGSQQRALFEKLKTLICEELVLAHPKLDVPFELEVDASGY